MQVLQRILNARQFSLKLIANVTYGYTAAGFSGRMPMAELADSIVQVTHLRLRLSIRDTSVTNICFGKPLQHYEHTNVYDSGQRDAVRVLLDSTDDLVKVPNVPCEHWM